MYLDHQINILTHHTYMVCVLYISLDICMSSIIYNYVPCYSISIVINLYCMQTAAKAKAAAWKPRHETAAIIGAGPWLH